MPTKQTVHIFLIFLVAGVIALVSTLATRPDARCAVDGTPIQPNTEVTIQAAQGETVQFCSVCCAQTWLSENQDDGMSITVTDEVSGEKIDVSLAYWIESDSYSRRESGCKIHTFKEQSDAARHILQYNGSESSGYLAGLGRKLPWAGKFTAKSLKGTEVDLANYHGQVVFIRFWNSGNPFTKKDLGYLAEAHRRWQGSGFTVLAMNVEQPESTVQNFTAQLALPFPVLLDPTGEIADRYGVQGFPTGFVIDKNGIIHNQSIGEIPPDLMEPLIAPLL